MDTEFIEPRRQHDSFWLNKDQNKAFVGCMCGEISHGGVAFSFQTAFEDNTAIMLNMHVDTYAPICSLLDRIKHAWYLFRYGTPRWTFLEIAPTDALKMADWITKQATKAMEEEEVRRTRRYRKKGIVKGENFG